MTASLRPGVVTAGITLAIDQAAKVWLLYGTEIGRHGARAVTPFFDLVLTWNTGISYGWFQNEGPLGQAILVGVKIVAIIVLAAWMARSQAMIATLSLGLIIGGAIGNGIDRLIHGAVVDYALLHMQIGDKTYNWYVFNLADVAIVAGVLGLLYDSFFGKSAVKVP